MMVEYLYNMTISWQNWRNRENIDPKNFICGYCGHDVGSSTGYVNTPSIRIYICTYCGKPTFFDNEEQYPGALLGRTINNLPLGVEQIYKEMRDSYKHSSFTAVSLLGRKLIMHLAVDIAGAEEGKNFVSYIEYLKESGYIPPYGDKLLEYLKNIGNEKNHEIKIGTKEEATKIIKLVEVLLIFMYEFPSEFPYNKEEQS